jgi:hypothetical protein
VTKLLEAPIQQAGQLSSSTDSSATPSWKHGVESLEQSRPVPSQLTELNTTGELVLVRSNVAWHARPAASAKSCVSLMVSSSELHESASNASHRRHVDTGPRGFIRRWDFVNLRLHRVAKVSRLQRAARGSRAPLGTERFVVVAVRQTACSDVCTWLKLSPARCKS